MTGYRSVFPQLILLSESQCIAFPSLIEKLCKSLSVRSSETHSPNCTETRPFGWPSLLQAYAWPTRSKSTSPNGYAENAKIVGRFEDELGLLAQKLSREREISVAEERYAIKICRDIFRWGKVERGSSKRDITFDMVAMVLENATSWTIKHEAAPLDSGWTKVAAFGSSWLERSSQAPQVIFDSRVSNALLKRLDEAISSIVAYPTGTRPPVELDELRRVPGRGGSRKAIRLKETALLRWKYWRSGSKRWLSQFAGSAIVAQIRDHLNAHSEEFGPMPLPGGGHCPWTVRGVEMVLFMDGY